MALFAIRLTFLRRASTLPLTPYIRFSKAHACAKLYDIAVCALRSFLLARSAFNSSETNRSLRTLASSKGRGNRAAGWFADHIADQGDDQMESLALAEGIKGWATAGDEYVQWMLEYDAQVWSSS